MKELVLTDKIERNANEASETNEQEVKTDSENLELLKSQKSLSRVTSNLEILKKRVVSLEDFSQPFMILKPRLMTKMMKVTVSGGNLPRQRTSLTV